MFDGWKRIYASYDGRADPLILQVHSPRLQDPQLQVSGAVSIFFVSYSGMFCAQSPRELRASEAGPVKRALPLLASTLR